MLTQNAQIKRAERTRKLIEHYRKIFPADKLWSRLHGVLCMTHPFTYSVDGDDCDVVDNVFDGMMIAEELDRLNAEAARELQR